MRDSLVWLSAKMLYHKRAKYMNEKKTTKHMNKLKIQECQIFQVRPCSLWRMQNNKSPSKQFFNNSATPKIHCLEMIYYKIPK